MRQVLECGTNLDPGFPADAAFKYHVRVQPLHLFQVRGNGCPLGPTQYESLPWLPAVTA